jgi:hypothetical protein
MITDLDRPRRRVYVRIINHWRGLKGSRKSGKSGKSGGKLAICQPCLPTPWWQRRCGYSLQLDLARILPSIVCTEGDERCGQDASLHPLVWKALTRLEVHQWSPLIQNTLSGELLHLKEVFAVCQASCISPPPLPEGSSSRQKSMRSSENPRAGAQMPETVLWTTPEARSANRRQLRICLKSSGNSLSLCLVPLVSRIWAAHKASQPRWQSQDTLPILAASCRMLAQKPSARTALDAVWSAAGGTPPAKGSNRLCSVCCPHSLIWKPPGSY